MCMVASYKYLGHYTTDDLSDDDDINRQRRTLFVQGNIILRKFNMCSLGVKLTLFRTYCSPMCDRVLIVPSRWRHCYNDDMVFFKTLLYNAFTSIVLHISGAMSSDSVTVHGIVHPSTPRHLCTVCWAGS